MSRIKIFNVGIGTSLVTQCSGCDPADMFSPTEAFPSASLLGLVVDQPCDLVEPFLAGRAAEDVADAAIGPEHRPVALAAGIAHMGGLHVRPGGIEGEAFAAWAFIHQERRRAVRPRQ